MTHRFAFEAVDRTFRDITEIDKPFGGTVASGYTEPDVPVILVQYRVNSLYNIHFIYQTVQYIKLTNKNLSCDILFLFRYTYYYYYYNYITLKLLYYWIN